MSFSIDGKTAIVVRDVAGFATSRLGVLLGAEAMRMLETGVASARLEELVKGADESGYIAARRAAARELRSAGRRLRPQPGSEWAGLSERERDVALMVAEGLGIIMVSSELPEVLGMADRILVMRRGRLRATFTRAEATPERIVRAATDA